MIEWKNENGIALVTMTREGNTHNMDFAKAMNQTLDAVVEDASVNAMVLTSSDPKTFSLGIDLPWVGETMSKNGMTEIRTFLHTMNSVFRKLLLFPVPAIAAINGHAYGNGTILACACDFRFMRKDKGFFCFPEVDVSVPFLPGMLGTIRKSVPDTLFNLMALTGARMTAGDLEKHHVIVKACENQDELMKETLAFAATFAKKRGIFGELKKRMHKEIIRLIDEDDPLIIDPIESITVD